jgi:rubrerythrin
MPRGLTKATNYYQKIEAWRDWNAMAKKIAHEGYGDLVLDNTPPDGAGWRTVDKFIARLRSAYQSAVEHSVHPTGLWLCKNCGESTDEPKQRCSVCNTPRG